MMLSEGDGVVSDEEDWSARDFFVADEDGSASSDAAFLFSVGGILMFLFLCVVL